MDRILRERGKDYDYMVESGFFGDKDKTRISNRCAYLFTKLKAKGGRDCDPVLFDVL